MAYVPGLGIALLLIGILVVLFTTADTLGWILAVVGAIIIVVGLVQGDRLGRGRGPRV